MLTERGYSLRSVDREKRKLLNYESVGTAMKLKEYLVSGYFFHRVVLAIDRRIAKTSINLFYRSNEIIDNKVFVMTYDNTYTCNPKYIVEELLSRHSQLDIVWVMNAKGTNGWQFPKGVRTVRRGSLEMFEEQATAKVWIDNALNCVWFGVPKKNDQIYINTWHGSLGIKKLGGDANWMKKARNCKRVTTYCVTNSAFEENIFRETFWPTNEFLPYGHARNDVLLDLEKRKAAADKVCRRYSIKSGEKIALYAPTFRDNNDVSCYDMDYDLLEQALKERFGGNWRIIVRHHFKNKNRVKKVDSTQELLIDGTGYDEMQELLAAADVGITDYSSWAFDYVLTRKPVFVFATDIEEYSRGFYYPLETTPFPIARTNRELVSNIETFDSEEYMKNVEAFLEDKGCYETGRAAKLIADKIEDVTIGNR